jgi:hypothetical protein
MNGPRIQPPGSPSEAPTHDWDLADRALRKLAAFNEFTEERKNAFRLTVAEAIAEGRTLRGSPSEADAIVAACEAWPTVSGYVPCHYKQGCGCEMVPARVRAAIAALYRETAADFLEQRGPK